MTPQEQIDTLRQQVQALIGQVQRLQNQIDHPLRRLFLAKPSESSDLQWQERTVVNGALADFEDGRRCTSDSDPEALIETTDEVLVMEVRDGDVARYVPISTRTDGFTGTQTFVVDVNYSTSTNQLTKTLIDAEFERGVLQTPLPATYDVLVDQAEEKECT